VWGLSRRTFSLKLQKRFLLATSLILLATSNYCPAFSDNYSEEPPAADNTSVLRDTETPRSANVYQSHKGDTGSNSTPLLKGEVNLTVPRGTPIRMKLAAVPSYPLRMMERDLDGELLPAKLGQEITARVSEDLYVDDHKVIPEGTLFIGHVSKILPPRRVGRPGSLCLSFDALETPDGKKFAFRAEADNFKPSTWKSKAKGFGIIAAHSAGGAIVGALVAYQIFGMQNTIAMHGYNIAGGAAAGALLATGFAVMRHGPKATLEPGDDLNMQIDTDLLMPVAVEAKPKQIPNSLTGLEIDVKKAKLVRDGLGGKLFTIDATISNQSDRELSSIDLYLEDTNGNLSPITSNQDDNCEFLFKLEPHSRKTVHVSFAIRYPKLKRHLVWLEHDDKTVCYRQLLP
jgi:hypothetical protein